MWDYELEAIYKKPLLCSGGEILHRNSEYFLFYMHANGMGSPRKLTQFKP